MEQHHSRCCAGGRLRQEDPKEAPAQTQTTEEGDLDPGGSSGGSEKWPGSDLLGKQSQHNLLMDEM